MKSRAADAWFAALVLGSAIFWCAVVVGSLAACARAEREPDEDPQERAVVGAAFVFSGNVEPEDWALLLELFKKGPPIRLWKAATLHFYNDCLTAFPGAKEECATASKCLFLREKRDFGLRVDYPEVCDDVLAAVDVVAGTARGLLPPSQTPTWGGMGGGPSKWVYKNLGAIAVRRDQLMRDHPAMSTLDATTTAIEELQAEEP